MTEIRDTENFSGNSKKLEVKDLFLESWFLFKTYFPQITQIFCLFIIISLLNIVLHGQKGAAGFWNLLFLVKGMISIVNIVLHFTIIKVIDQNLSVVNAMLDIAKRILPISITIILPTAALISLFIISIPILTAIMNFFVIAELKMLTTVIFAILFCIMIFCFIRISFLSFIVLLEKKYYLKAITRSFCYSHNNSFSILLKSTIVAIPALVASLIIITMITPLISNLSFVKGDEFAQESMNALLEFYSSQFMIISFYLLYKFHKLGIPENCSITIAGQKSKLVTIASSGLFLLLFMVLIFILK